MFRAFASRGAGKKHSDNLQRTIQAEGSSSSNGAVHHVRVAILGTGFSGLGMAIRLKQQGIEDFVVIEKASDIGGTWRDNTYPGCACDIQSHLYSFSFALNPNWSRTYSGQREIWSYLRRCARRFGIIPHIQWNSEVLNASWNDDDQCWHISTSQGQLRADIFIMGNGPLSEPSLSAIPGIESFEGVLFHSAHWKHDYDLTGKRVAVIGTGASAIQFVPQIQPQVGHLCLFQRTPPWIVPRNDHEIPAWQRAMFSLLPITQHIARSRIYWLHELTALGLVYRSKIMEGGMRVAQQHLEEQVPDRKLRAKLTPHYAMGCKRILVSDDFYPALSQHNVEVITEPIREVRARSIVTKDSREREIDTIICGTGFHVTDTRLPQYIHGRDSRSLGESWQASPQAYLGAAVAGFPNFFLLIGPNTGLGHNSMVYMIESQINYIIDCLHRMDKQKIRTFEVQSEAQEAFNTEVQKRMQGTVWTSGCVSWYLDARGRNTTIWPGLTFEFRRRTRHFDPQHYNLIPQRESSQSEKAVVGQNEMR